MTTKIVVVQPCVALGERIQAHERSLIEQLNYLKRLVASKWLTGEAIRAEKYLRSLVRVPTEVEADAKRAD